MKKNTVIKLSALAASFLTTASTAVSQVVYSEDFTDFAAGTEWTKGVGTYTLLNDGDGNSFWDANTATGNQVKPLEYSGSGTSFYWGATGTSTVDRFPGGVLEPQAAGNTDYKAAGVFIDPVAFTPGTGTYRLSYDIVGAEVSNTAAAIQIATFTGIGADGNNTAGFDAAGANLFNVGGSTATSVTDNRFGTQGSATLENFFVQAVDTSVAGTFTMDFTYTAGETVGLLFVGYASGVQYDNLEISAVPEPATFALLAGIATLGLVLYRRRNA